MELELDFEDDDFKEEKKTQIVNSSVYQAKINRPFWFDDADTTDVDTAANIFKFRGDNSYKQGLYNDATKHYRQAIDSLPTQSRSLRHDFEEGLARCYVHLDKHTEALAIANKMCLDATTVDQQMQGLMLLSHIQSSLTDLQGEEDTIKKLIGLHPFNVNFWIKLADIYKSQGELFSVKDRVKVVTCLIRARLLLRCTRRGVGSFVKNRYEKLQRTVENEIKELNPSEEWIHKATQFLGEDIFKMDQVKENEIETSLMEEVPTDFDDHWFLWAKNLCLT